MRTGENSGTDAKAKDVYEHVRKVLAKLTRFLQQRLMDHPKVALSREPKRDSEKDDA
jgi:hypothetical protein